jgi:hypothetical protein
MGAAANAEMTAMLPAFLIKLISSSSAKSKDYILIVNENQLHLQSPLQIATCSVCVMG